jgi:hypothetical protein
LTVTLPPNVQTPVTINPAYVLPGITDGAAGDPPEHVYHSGTL